MKLTNEQVDAIESKDSNIIVSAGAGSGKTFVLTKRIERIIQQGISINDLLVLTFTEKASLEMKNRIRKMLASKDEYSEELNKLDSSLITTFDSFTSYLVKKYYYYLDNVDKNFKIALDGMIEIELKKIIDLVFDEYYDSSSLLFTSFIEKMVLKDDKNLKKEILLVYDKITTIYDKEAYFSLFAEEYYSEKKIKALLNDYINLIKNKIDEAFDVLESLKSNTTFYDAVFPLMETLSLSKTYGQMKEKSQFVLPRLTKASDYEKEAKNLLSKKLKELNTYLEFDSEEDIKANIIENKEYSLLIIEIIKKIDQRITEVKHKNNIYTFNDIALMAIKLVLENEEIALELKNSYYEILVDEYQDTNDIQETLISLISNNNVYMVGDVKQSIYRFRKANPKLFQDKYDLYKTNTGGKKIDLNFNFRSRKEVVAGINLIFNKIMSSNIGGANYLEEHQMTAGNNSYLESSDNYDLEIYDYDSKENQNFSKVEQEAFIIANDINNKIANHYQVMAEGSLRDLTYNDICLIVDKSSGFDIIKKIFEFNHIPLSVFKEENISAHFLITIYKHILNLLIKTKSNNFDDSFKFSLVTILRSFLFNFEDGKIFDICTNQEYESTLVYQLCKDINNQVKDLSNIYDLILDKFEVYKKLVYVGDIKRCESVLKFIYNCSLELSSLGYQITDLYDYINNIQENELNIKMNTNINEEKSVSLMTIHKSKGLEFPICYVLGFGNEFNMREFNEKLLYHKDYGIILPTIYESVQKTLYKETEKKELISEKIRLLYVALTRAKEKNIIVASLKANDDNHSIITDNIKLTYKNFNDILLSIYPLIKCKINPVNLTNDILSNDYKKQTLVDVDAIENKKKIVIEKFENNFDTDLILLTNASHKVDNILTKEAADNLSLGRKIHECLETFDFNNSDLSLKNYDKTIQEKIIKLLKTPFMNNIETKTVIKEYEFIDDVNLSHGIIDLLIISDSKLLVVDYKLNEIDKPYYIDQVKTYLRYLKNTYQKEVGGYLYSLIKGSYIEVNLNE